MSLSKKPTSWEDLPTEVKVQVLDHIRDPGSLGALFNASPTLYRTCGHIAPTYAEKALTAGSVCGHTAVLFRLCALIRTGRLPVHSTEQFYRLVTGEAMCYYTRIHESRRGIAPRRLDDDVPPEIVRGLLATAGYIERLAADCLQFYLDRFHSLRPEHPMPWELDLAGQYDYSHRDPQCQPALIEDLEGFEWEEEQRAVRALWRYQLIYELKRAVLITKSLAWRNPAALEATPAVELPPGPGRRKGRSFYGWRYRYQDWVRSVRSQVRSIEQDWIECITYSPEYEEINSVAEFINKRYGAEMGASYRNGSLCISRLRCIADPIPPLHPVGKDWKKLVRAGAALEIYFYYAPRGPYRGNVPLQFYHTDFSHFVGFGFAFWSVLRLQRYGLHGLDWDAHRDQRWNWIFHAWYSIRPEKRIE